MRIAKSGVAAAIVAVITLSGIPALALSTINNSVTAQAASSSTAGAKLSAAKLKICQLRERSIDNIMARIAQRGQNQLNLFTTIANRAKTFYAKSGKSLGNYDALVADVNAKQTAAQTAVDTVDAVKSSFTCGGTNPDGAGAAFKSDVKTEISALQDYRTSIKNLIEAIKSVETTSAAGSTSGDNQ